jgi:hypothetical protein
MPSSADPRRIAHWVEHRAQRLRRDAASQAQQALDHEQQAASLRTDADAKLLDAQVGEELGLDRQRLFDRLRAVAMARAHVLECDLRARDLQLQAGQAREREQHLRRDAAHQQSRARRLEAAGARIEHRHRQALQRRQERQIQEEYACR